MDGPPGPKNADLHWLEQDAKAMLKLDNAEEALKLIEEKISPKQCEKKRSRKQEKNSKQEENAEYLSIVQDKSLQFKGSKDFATDYERLSGHVGSSHHVVPRKWNSDSDMPYKTIWKHCKII